MDNIDKKLNNIDDFVNTKILSKNKISQLQYLSSKGRTNDIVEICPFKFVHNSKLNVFQIYEKILETLRDIEAEKRYLYMRLSENIDRADILKIRVRLNKINSYPTCQAFSSRNILEQYKDNIFLPLTDKYNNFFIRHINFIKSVENKDTNNKELNSCHDNIDIPKFGMTHCPICGRNLKHDSEVIKLEIDEIDNTSASYKDTQERLTFVSAPKGYVRSDHFEEKLKQKLAKTKASIPNEVIDKIKNQLVNEKIIDLSTLKHDDIRRILKKLGLVKYYEVDYIIFSMITGVTVLDFDQSLMYRLKGMFYKVNETFKIIKNKGRTSLFVYDYIIHKLLEILKYDNYKKHFKPPKNPEKVKEYDKLWKQICIKLEWKFYATNCFM